MQPGVESLVALETSNFLEGNMRGFVLAILFSVFFGTMAYSADLDYPSTRSKRIDGPDYIRLVNRHRTTSHRVWNTRITIIEETDARRIISTRYVFQFQHHNGANTWRGSQYLRVQFYDANGTALLDSLINVSVPRDRCYRGAPHPAAQRGRLSENYFDIITRITVTPTPLAGNREGPC